MSRNGLSYPDSNRLLVAQSYRAEVEEIMMKLPYLVAVLGLVLFIAGHGTSFAGQDDYVVDVVAGSPGYDQLEPFIAEYTGMWDKYGIKVKFQGGSYRRANQLIAIGDFDAGYAQLSTSMHDYASGLPDIIAASSAANCSMIVASPEIESWADLKGKRIGVSSKYNVQWFTLIHEILPRFGLSRDDVQLALVPIPETASAILTGGVAAAFPFAPYGQDAVAKGAKVLLRPDQMIDKSKINSDMLRNALVLNKNFIDKHRDIARRIVWAHLDAVHILRTNPELAIEVLKHYNPTMDPKLIKAAYDHCGWDYQKPPKVWIDTLIKWMEKDNVMKKHVTYDEVTDFSLQDGYRYPGWETIKEFEKGKK